MDQQLQECRHADATQSLQEQMQKLQEATLASAQRRHLEQLTITFRHMKCDTLSESCCSSIVDDCLIPVLQTTTNLSIALQIGHAFLYLVPDNRPPPSCTLHALRALCEACARFDSVPLARVTLALTSLLIVTHDSRIAEITLEIMQRYILHTDLFVLGCSILECIPHPHWDLRTRMAAVVAEGVLYHVGPGRKLLQELLGTAGAIELIDRFTDLGNRDATTAGAA